MLDKDIEQEMEAISKELDVCEKKRLQAVEKYFWQQMVYVVVGVAIMHLGVLLLEGSA